MLQSSAETLVAQPEPVGVLLQETHAISAPTTTKIRGRLTVLIALM
jgi:hypothetical protein